AFSHDLHRDVASPPLPFAVIPVGPAALPPAAARVEGPAVDEAGEDPAERVEAESVLPVGRREVPAGQAGTPPGGPPEVEEDVMVRCFVMSAIVAAVVDIGREGSEPPKVISRHFLTPRVDTARVSIVEEETQIRCRAIASPSRRGGTMATAATKQGFRFYKSGPAGSTSAPGSRAPSRSGSPHPADGGSSVRRDQHAPRGVRGAVLDRWPDRAGRGRPEGVPHRPPDNQLDSSRRNSVAAVTSLVLERHREYRRKDPNWVRTSVEGAVLSLGSAANGNGGQGGGGGAGEVPRGKKEDVHPRGGRSDPQPRDGANPPGQEEATLRARSSAGG
ncbi:hypothetical protein THAOC_25143, partial [Thalassiosira oceanica]